MKTENTVCVKSRTILGLRGGSNASVYLGFNVPESLVVKVGLDSIGVALDNLTRELVGVAYETRYIEDEGFWRVLALVPEEVMAAEGFSGIGPLYLVFKPDGGVEATFWPVGTIVDGGAIEELRRALKRRERWAVLRGPATALKMEAAMSGSVGSAL